MNKIINQHLFTFGRTPILVPYTRVTRENLKDVLRMVLPTFQKNSIECNKLYEFYRGEQPILYREKKVRPEIMNTIVVNRAYEIVTFKTGRFLYKDIQYTNRSDDKMKEVNALNTYMGIDNKAGKDRELVDWIHIAGAGYRMVKDASINEDVPFHTYSLDPRRTFVAYSDTVEKKAILAGYSTKAREGGEIYTLYTEDTIFTYKDNEIIGEERHLLGDVPIVEYPANYARLGSFEVVTELLNAINTATSNRMDGVEQFIQALLIFKNLDVPEDQIKNLQDIGAICIPSESDIEYLAQELNQTQTQTLIDDMYQAVLTICGMPNRNGGSSTSDNKGAVVLRDGWSAAATAVKETKQYFEASERRMLKMALKAFNIWSDVKDETHIQLTNGDIDIHFDEGEYENTLEKAQVLTMLLANDWVHPKNAYKFSNITSDPEAAYADGKTFHEEQEAKLMDEMDGGGTYTSKGTTEENPPTSDI